MNIPRMSYPQYRKARRLTHECCNYCNGNCLLLDDGEEFDLEKNTFQTLTLSRNEYNVNILQEGFDYFLVQAGVKEYSVPDLAPDGQEITTNMLLPDVSLMIKSDYWNNIPNYIAINDDVL